MFQMQPPVPDVSGKAAAPLSVPLDVNDPPITAGQNLHLSISLEDLSDMAPELIVSQSLSVLPIKEGSSSILMKSLFTSILEDVLTQMWILGTCSSELATEKTRFNIEYLKAIKYGVYDPNEVKDELDGIDVNNLHCDIYKLNKLIADRKHVNKVMLATYLGLTQSSTIEPLVSSITSMLEVVRHRTDLLEEEIKNKILRKELNKQVRQQRNHIKTVLYDTENIITKLNTQIEDSVLYAELGYRYIDNWQVARTEQHNQMILVVEKDPSIEVEYYKQKTEYELRVHNEVETLVTITMTETLQKIEDWMEKYDRDIEAIDLKIHVMKNKYDDKLNINIGLEETLEEHDLQMKNWVRFKNEREAARLYHEKMTNSGFIVQAWWRGLLVRLKLGPYKEAKKKKGGKK